jgi:hypothetical protein
MASTDVGSGLDRTFLLTERGSVPRTEILAGVTTFLAMAYILFLNPLILSGPDVTGGRLPFAAVLTVTALVAGVMTIAMGVLLAGLPVAYLLVMGSAYRRRRLLAFWDPWRDPLGDGFQVIQSLIAVGAGGLTGRGGSHTGDMPRDLDRPDEIAGADQHCSSADHLANSLSEVVLDAGAVLGILADDLHHGVHELAPCKWIERRHGLVETEADDLRRRLTETRGF